MSEHGTIKKTHFVHWSDAPSLNYWEAHVVNSHMLSSYVTYTLYTAWISNVQSILLVDHEEVECGTQSCMFSLFPKSGNDGKVLGLFSFRQVEKLESNGLGSKENLSEESKSSSTNSLDKIGSACTTPTSVSSPSSATSATDGGVRVQSIFHMK